MKLFCLFLIICIASWPVGSPSVAASTSNTFLSKKADGAVANQCCPRELIYEAKNKKIKI